MLKIFVKKKLTQIRSQLSFINYIADAVSIVC